MDLFKLSMIELAISTIIFGVGYRRYFKGHDDFIITICYLGFPFLCFGDNIVLVFLEMSFLLLYLICIVILRERKKRKNKIDS
ncbi:MAG: hypothetical protein EOM50_14465 [Erysipelotrichia bacterium]|nr:hypothetical protein [Erysipelotrichia bacterium]